MSVLKPNNNMKTKILMAVMVLGLLSCKKKASPVNVTSEEPDPCFNSQYSGTYHGYGISSVNTFTLGTLKVSKTGCGNCTLYLTTNTGGSYSDNNVTQLTLNSGGGFEGKLNNGNKVTLTLGTHLDVKAIGSYTFTGQKQ